MTSAIHKAAELLQAVVTRTPLQYNHRLSEEYKCDIFLKREDLQMVRSYKIRGAYNKIASLTPQEQAKGIVCASAGNHAQGVAYACCHLKIKGAIFMPATTPMQKVEQVKLFGKSYVETILSGDTFDDAYAKARVYEQEHGCVFIHPFDDEKVIEGQGTVGKEIVDEAIHQGINIDAVILPIGGGGLAAGVSSYLKENSPKTRIIGVEPAGAASMKISIENGVNTELQQIDKFVDGAAVKRVGDKTFAICKQNLEKILAVEEGKVCKTILKLYNEQAIVVEPAGALSIAALDNVKDEIVGKTVVCVVSGSNNDITRTEEIRERALLYEGKKHFFLIKFPQRAGALKEFVIDVLQGQDDIVYFQYVKKHNKESGPALIGLELANANDLQRITERLKEKGFGYEYVNQNNTLMAYLV